METAINKTTRSLFVSFPRNRCFGFIESRPFSDTVSNSASARDPDYYQSLRVKVTSSCDARHEDAVCTRIVDLTCLENRRTRFRLILCDDDTTIFRSKRTIKHTLRFEHDRYSFGTQAVYPVSFQHEQHVRCNSLVAHTDFVYGQVQTGSLWYENRHANTYFAKTFG